MSEYHEYMDRGAQTLTAEDAVLLHDFLARLHEAEYKHPVFAEGPYEGIAQVEAELGEAVQSLVKQEPEERWQDEMLDVLVTAWRFARKDWK